ncbi:MAG: aminotransferase class IV family protein [Sulfurimonas sp.]|uniref:aminotransferase class IV family protein n=1 Tax=Sulfurimonas sp. TaxID=2022749 RepID=UPI0025D282C6|nr:aminotransferase class IV family protein [Sulfurimonas sp.]MCK9491975.1 aminotransferase class IV family protein [Sulfurimonas sp.]
MKKTFFETIRVVDGEPLNLKYHQKRYESVLASLDVKKFKKFKMYIDPPKYGLYRCKIIYDAKDLSVEFFEYKKRDIKSLKVVFDDEISYKYKSTSREHLDKLFAKRGLCDDVLIVKNSFITDTTIANVAFYKDGLWYSPKKPLLCGTTRARLVDEKKLILKDIKIKDLAEYSGLALMNAMIDFDIITLENLKDTIC